MHVLCRDPKPEACDFVHSAFRWTLDGEGGATSDRMFLRDGDGALPASATANGGAVIVHVLPHGPIRPVFVTDKQRVGDVRAFSDLTDAELQRYHDDCVAAVGAVLGATPVQCVHANHLIYQPSVCAAACARHGVPFVIFPHGSSIEYIVLRDPRFPQIAKDAVAAAAKVISGSREVASRIERLYDAGDAGEAAALAALRGKQAVVGVGTDTSLFNAVPFAGRAAKVDDVLGFSDMFNGKTPQQRDELRARLLADGAGPAEWHAAVRGYKTSYTHKLPDTDFGDQLTALPWAATDAPVLLFLGALTVGKGVQTLITAFASLLEASPQAHLVIIGSGSYREVLEALTVALAEGHDALLDFLIAHGVSLDKPGDAGALDQQEGVEDLALFFADAGRRAKVLASAKAHNLCDRVHFVGRVNHALLSNVFPCVDVAVFPSMLTEAYPLVLMEALANGVVPVLPSHSGFAESLHALRTPMGDAFVDSITMPAEPARRVEGLASLLAGLVGDLAGLRGTSGKLRAVAEENFDWQGRCRDLAAEHTAVACVPRTGGGK